MNLYTSRNDNGRATRFPGGAAVLYFLAMTHFENRYFLRFPTSDSTLHLTSVCQQKVKFIFYDIQCRFSPFP